MSASVTKYFREEDAMVETITSKRKTKRGVLPVQTGRRSAPPVLGGGSTFPGVGSGRRMDITKLRHKLSPDSWS